MDNKKGDNSDADRAEKFRALKCCVIIPTYNNGKTLHKVISDVSHYTSDIIVVNDGSTDETASIISSFENLQIVSYSPNKGKGVALCSGLKYAAEKGYVYAITIDSDGQHFAEDIPHFISKINELPGALIIGARNMDQAFVPGKSNLGNRISTFCFWLETGIRIPDTQSGFRLYPLEPLKNMRFFTTKYEFEIEVIVRAAWKDVPVVSVPVKVFYAPAETRISHFRPFKDFTRVGILNSILITLSIIYIKPRLLWRNLKKKNLRKRLHEELINPAESNIHKSVSVGFGAFMGIVPFWGFQMLIAISLSYLMKLNKVLVLLAANISLPPLVPFIIYLSYVAGGLVMGNHSENVTFNNKINLEWAKHNFFQYVVGSFVLATVTGITFGISTFLSLKYFRKQAT